MPRDRANADPGRGSHRAGAVRALAALSLLALAASCVSTSVPVHDADSGSVPIFADEFDGTAVDRDRWALDSRSRRIINDELQAYVPDAVRVEDGRLLLTARPGRARYGGALQRYTSGIVSSHESFAFRYGVFAVRARIPRGRGLWPAAWLLPRSGEWPPEVDVFEFRGHQPHRLVMTHHWRSLFGGHRFAAKTWRGPDFSRGFHTYSLEWTPRRLTWRVDGVVRHVARRHVPRDEMYIKIALAVGGTFPGRPGRSTEFPATLEIDWVRVWRGER